MSALAEVEAALERGDHAEALEHALEAWRDCRREQLAIVIERLSAKVASTRTRPGGKGVDAKQKAWIALAKKRDPGDLELLLATLADVRKAKPIEARLATLEGRRDPRIAKAMHAFLQHPPIPGATGIPAVEKALALVIETADPRSSNAFRELISHVGTAGGGMATWGLRNRLALAGAQLRTALDAAPTGIAAREQKLLDAIERKLEDKSTARRDLDPKELFAAVYANPADDQARSVLADLLQERSDPRGELIALQLARAAGGKRSKRETELLAAHGREWLGPIEPVVLKSGLVYERGFLAKCGVRSDGIQNASDLIDCPEWRTVTDIDVRSWAHPRSLLEAIPFLRVVRGVKWSNDLGSHPTLERIEVDILTRYELLVKLRLPALREFEASSCHGEVKKADVFLRSALCAQLNVLSISARTPEYWVPALVELGLPRAGYANHTANPWRLWFEGETVTAEFLWKGAPDNHDHIPLADLLVHVPGPKRRRVVIATPIKVGAELAVTLKRFASHQVAK